MKDLLAVSPAALLDASAAARLRTEQLIDTATEHAAR
jgi:hypothetical protein